jgi:nickel-type superoxide dismutase maturation protease
MLARVEVHGRSMEPTLRAGQRLLVSTLTARLRAPRPGEVWVLRHPSEPFLLVKRVHARVGLAFEVRGDNPRASTDSEQYGPVPRASFVGRVVASYRPLARVR